MSTDMLLFVLSVFTLLLQTHSQRLSDQSTLTVSPASVYKESNTVQLKTDGATDAEETPRETASTASLFTTVKAHNERPNITVVYDSPLGEFRIKCEIPGSENTGCGLFLGEDNKPLLKTDSHKISGKILCSFTIKESDLFIKLGSVKSKSVSCKYSPKTDPSKSSPYSDKYNLTAFLLVQKPEVTKHQLLNTEPKTEESTTSFLPFQIYQVTNQSASTTKEATMYIIPTVSTITISTELQIMRLFLTSMGIILSGLVGIRLYIFNRRKQGTKSCEITEVVFVEVFKDRSFRVKER